MTDDRIPPKVAIAIARINESWKEAEQELLLTKQKLDIAVEALMSCANIRESSDVATRALYKMRGELGKEDEK